MKAASNHPIVGPEEQHTPAEGTYRTGKDPPIESRKEHYQREEKKEKKCSHLQIELRKFGRVDVERPHVVGTPEGDGGCRRQIQKVSAIPQAPKLSCHAYSSTVSLINKGGTEATL